MQDERIRPDQQDAQIDQAIMGLLLTETVAIWAVEEVVREIRDRVAALDGLNRLAAAGLIHRVDGFVFATRAAARASDLALA